MAQKYYLLEVFRLIAQSGQWNFIIPIGLMTFGESWGCYIMMIRNIFVMSLQNHLN